MKSLSKNLLLISGTLTGCFLLSLMPILSPESDLVEMLSYLFLLLPIMLFSLFGLTNLIMNHGFNVADLEVMEAALVYLLPAVFLLTAGLWLRQKHWLDRHRKERLVSPAERWSVRVNQVLGVGLVLMGIPLLHLALSFAGCLCANVSNGQTFFGRVPIAPFGFPQTLASVMFLFWPMVSLLLVCRNWSVCRMMVMLLLGIHYFGILLISWQVDWQPVWYVFASAWGAVLVCFALYLGTHVFMWGLLLRNPLTLVAGDMNKQEE